MFNCLIILIHQQLTNYCITVFVDIVSVDVVVVHSFGIVFVNDITDGRPT